MAITFDDTAKIAMQLWDNADAVTNWSGDHDDLDLFGENIQGSGCIVAGLRKNTISDITLTLPLFGVSSLDQMLANVRCINYAHLDSYTITVGDANAGTSSFNVTSDVNPVFQQLAFDLSTGSLNLDVYGLSYVNFNIDTTGDNIATIDNNYWDAIYVGQGHTLIGTTTSDSLFAEAYINDTVTQDLWTGVLNEYKGKYFAQADISINTTLGNSYNESLTFYETLNGKNTYLMEVTGTADFKNTNIDTSGAVILNIDTLSAVSFSFVGGSLSGDGQTTFGAGQTISNTTFNDRGITVTSSPLTDVTINNSDFISTTALLTRCIFNNPIGTRAVSTASLDNISNCTFTSSGTGHAVDLTSAGAFTTSTISWDSTFSNYGSDGTTDAVIKVNVADGETLTIDSSNGIPTYLNTGNGTVSVQSGLVTLTLTGLVAGTEVRVLENGTTTVIDGIESSGTSWGYTYSYSAGLKVDIVILNVGYKYIFLGDFELSSTSSPYKVQQQPDANYVNN